MCHRHIFADFNFSLVTTFGEVAMYSPPQNVEAETLSGGYLMTNIVCQSSTTTQGTSGFCHVKAERMYAPALINTILPSILFVLIAFLSLNLNIKHAMPRVAATLFGG